MSKKKKKSVVTKPVHTENSKSVEIDYERLSEAIVEAINRTKELPEEESHEYEKMTIMKAIALCLLPKKKVPKHFGIIPIIVVLGILYRVMAVAGIALVIIADVGVVKHLYLLGQTGFHIVVKVLIIACALGITIVLLLFFVFLWGSAKSLEQEKDRSYVLDSFTGMISIISLVVAVIALMR